MKKLINWLRICCRFCSSNDKRQKLFESCSYFKISITENQREKSPKITNTEDKIGNLIKVFDDPVDYMKLCSDDEKLVNNYLKMAKDISKRTEKRTKNSQIVSRGIKSAK